MIAYNAESSPGFPGLLFFCYGIWEASHFSDNTSKTHKNSSGKIIL